MGGNQAWLLHCFLAHRYKRSCEGHLSSTVLWRTEMIGWILRSWYFVFIWLSRHRSCSVKTDFPSLPLTGMCLLALRHQPRIDTTPLQFKVKSLPGFRGSQGRLQNCISFWGHWVPSRLPVCCQPTWGIFLIKAKNAPENEAPTYSAVIT